MLLRTGGAERSLRSRSFVPPRVGRSTLRSQQHSQGYALATLPVRTLRRNHCLSSAVIDGADRHSASRPSETAPPVCVCFCVLRVLERY